MSKQFKQARAWSSQRRRLGPTRDDEWGMSVQEMMDEGVVGEFNTKKKADAEINRRTKARREAAGTQAYSTAEGRLIPAQETRTRQAMERNAARAEKAAQRQGLSAEDYWERNPESKSMAVNTKGESVAVMDLNRQFREEQAAREARFARVREAGRQSALARAGRPQRDLVMEDGSTELNQAWLNQVQDLQTKLKDAGGNEYVDAALTDKNNITTFSPEKARAILAKHTFQKWENDEILDRQAVQLERDKRAQRSYLLSARRGAFGPAVQERANSEEQTAALQQIETELNQGYGKPDFWREQAELLDGANARLRVAEDNIVSANNATAASAQENQENLQKMLQQLYRDFEDGKFSADGLSRINAFIAAMGGSR